MKEPDLLFFKPLSPLIRGGGVGRDIETLGILTNPFPALGRMLPAVVEGLVHQFPQLRGNRRTNPGTLREPESAFTIPGFFGFPPWIGKGSREKTPDQGTGSPVQVLGGTGEGGGKVLPGYLGSRIKSGKVSGKHEKPSVIQTSPRALGTLGGG